MKHESIVFDQLLKSVLPVDRLPLVDQADIRSTLLDGDPHRIEKVALEAIDKLIRLGHLRLIEEVASGDERILRYRDLTSANTISIRLPGEEPDRSTIRMPLPLRQWRGAASLESVRAILTLDNRILGKETNQLASVPEILRQLVEASRSILGCDAVNFAPVGKSPEPVEGIHPIVVAEPYDPYLVQEWVVDRNYLIYLPDLAPAEAEQTFPEDMRSLAMVRLGDPSGEVSGALQAWSRRPHFFNEDRLGLLSLLSESGSDLLSRHAILGNLVFVDAATDVYNRSYFNIQMDNEIARARREGKSLALVIFDIDDFKRFNTNYGYEGGNDVLARVAGLLKSELRPFDSVARWGGEEFALILTAPITLDDARMVTDRLRKAIEKNTFTITGLEGKTHSVNLTVSGGGGIYPEDAVSGADLWRAANAALMWSKEHGKNRVTFFSELAGGEPHLEESS